MSRRRIEEIEAEVARSRARLDETLRHIEHKLSASGMVDDALASLRRTRHGDVVDRAMGVLRDNPLPVLAVMAGIGWLIGRAGSRRQDIDDQDFADRAYAEAERRAHDPREPNPSRSHAFSRRRKARAEPPGASQEDYDEAARPRMRPDPAPHSRD